jgi:phosphohistidine phosphatase
MEPEHDVRGGALADGDVLAVLRLTLLRHGHAENRHPSGEDFQRRLDDLGRTEVDASARQLATAGLVPDLVLASPAQRTRDTAARLVLQAALVKVPLRFEPGIYNATLTRLVSIVAATPARIRHLLLVGHNPGISEFANVVAGDKPQPGLATAQFRTVTLQLADWAALGSAHPVEKLDDT